MGWGKKKNADAGTTEVDLPRDAEYEAVDPEGESGYAEAGSVFARMMRIEGQLRGHGDLQVDGTVHGSIQLDGGRLTVGADGAVHGEISADSVYIEGAVFGDVVATDRVEILAGGSLQGDIVAERIVLADGARFRGNIDMGEAEPRAANDSSASRKGGLANLFDEPAGGEPTGADGERSAADALLDEVSSPLDAERPASEEPADAERAATRGE